MTYQAKRAGASMSRCPIRFVDRVDGESKMSTFIVVEALGPGDLVGGPAVGGAACGSDHSRPRPEDRPMKGANSILVVDDEPYITDVVTAALRFEGFASDEAVDRRRGPGPRRGSGGYDLIVLDVMLPDIEGFEVCRRLRAEDIGTPSSSSPPGTPPPTS